MVYPAIANNGVELTIRCESAGGGHTCDENCGSLTAIGGEYAAGIGGGRYDGGRYGDGSNITISDGITLATMHPMGARLNKTLEEAHFDYSREDFEADWKEVSEVYDEADVPENAEELTEEEPEEEDREETAEETPRENTAEDVLESIKKAKELMELGILSEAEFAEMKTKLIAKL